MERPAAGADDAGARRCSPALRRSRSAPSPLPPPRRPAITQTNPTHRQPGRSSPPAAPFMSIPSELSQAGRTAWRPSTAASPSSRTPDGSWPHLGYGGDTLQAFGEVGWRVPVSTPYMASWIEPFAGAASVGLRTSRFAETPGPASLVGAAGSYGYGITTLVAALVRAPDAERHDRLAARLRRDNADRYARLRGS
jgi:hypothetical protein